MQAINVESTVKGVRSDVYIPYRERHQPWACPLSVIQHLQHSAPLERNQELRVSACCFTIHDDSTLITQTTFPPTNLTRTFRAGFIQSWDLNGAMEGHSDSLFTYAPRPDLSMSPDGQIISTILNSSKGIIYLTEKIDDECTLEPCKFECVFGSDSFSARMICCVFSCDGLLVVTIGSVTTSVQHGHEYHELCLWKVGLGRVLKRHCKISCENCLPMFSGLPHSCTFSTDGKLIALSTTASQLYVLKTTNLEVCTVIRSIVFHNNICMCLFAPTYSENTLAVCLSDGIFQIWNICSESAHCMLEREVTSGLNKLTTMNYSLDVSLLAFGATSGDVLIYETEFYQCLYILRSTKVTDNVFSLQVCSFAFSKSCQELAVGYNDGYVRIWQLPIKMDLQHMCRMEILQLVPENMVSKLPLPESLKAYLLFKDKCSI